MYSDECFLNLLVYPSKEIWLLYAATQFPLLTFLTSTSSHQSRFTSSFKRSPALIIHTNVGLVQQLNPSFVAMQFPCSGLHPRRTVPFYFLFVPFTLISHLFVSPWAGLVHYIECFQTITNVSQTTQSLTAEASLIEIILHHPGFGSRTPDTVFT